MSNTNAQKVHLINFTRLINRFKPELDKSLVNENNPQGWTGKYILDVTISTGAPTQDQIINAAYGALGDIKTFIQEHEQAKKDLEDLRMDAVVVHKVLIAAGISTNDMAEGTTLILQRFRQCLDIIVAACKLKPERLNAFQADAREFVVRFLSREKAEEAFGAINGQVSSFAPLPESEAKPEGDTGENPNSGN
jgi:hypothetical protein